MEVGGMGWVQRWSESVCGNMAGTGGHMGRWYGNLLQWKLLRIYEGVCSEDS